MRRRGYLVLILMAALTRGQTVLTEGQRSYLQARKVLEAGVQAMGGTEALRSLQTVRRQLSGGWLNPFQGQHPYPDPGPSLTLPPTIFSDEFLSFIDYGANRWFESLNESDSSGDRIVQIDVVTGDAGFESFAYFDEKPIYHAFDASDLPSLRTQKFRRYPEGLLRMALDRPETLEWVGATEEFGRKQQVISFADPMGTRLLLYFDQGTGLLTKSEYLRVRRFVGYLPPAHFLAELNFALGMAEMLHARYAESFHSFRAAADCDPSAPVAPEALYWAAIAAFRRDGRKIEVVKQHWEDIRARYPQSTWWTRADVFDVTPTGRRGTHHSPS